MKTMNLVSFACCLMLVLFMASCRKSENKIELPYNYVGGLKVVYSKGFPSFTSSAMLGVSLLKDGTVTFSGGGDTDSFDAEDIYYEGGDPVTKVRMTGTLTFHGANGEVKILDDKAYLLVRVKSSINGQMTVWGWDDQNGWIQALDTPFTYEENYSDRTLQFSLDNASSLTGENIMRTLPDLQGTFTYGYNLLLIPG